MNTPNVLILGAVGIVLLFISGMALDIFRARVKEAEVVGVLFDSETVLNRRVLQATPKSVVVWNRSMTYKITVSRELLFLPDTKAGEDLKVEE